ncbi:unnamed protein product [Alopecurus aequalis]
MASWMMLDRYVYRRDDDGFPDESRAPLRATSSTSLGQAFDVAFLPAEPPAISRLYVRWPGGTTPEDGNGTDIVAAHRDLLLLRLTSIQHLDRSPYRRYVQDHFICIASSDPAGDPRLQLKRLPLCTIPMVVSHDTSLGSCCWSSDDDHHEFTEGTMTADDDYTEGMMTADNDYTEGTMTADDDYIEGTMTADDDYIEGPMTADDDYIEGTMTATTTQEQQRVFFPNSLGLVRARFPAKYDEQEDEFAVAQLAGISEIPGTGMMEAEVCVLRSRVSAGVDDNEWEVKKIPIQHDSYEYHKLYSWSMSLAFKPADAVVTFNQSICWVNYDMGSMLFYEVFEEERPKISYLELSTQNRPSIVKHPGFLEMNRSVCITSTDGGDVLKYISAIRASGELRGPIPPSGGFLIISHTLTTTETGEMEWVRDLVVTCIELWVPNTSSYVPPLRYNSLMFPLVSMDDPNIVHFMLSGELSEEGDRKVRKVSVVTIDFVTNKVKSMVPYIKGDEDLGGEDADMVKEKSHLLKSFLPSQFPKFFNLTRDHLGHI